jgi:DNA-binding NarL/FixJ family response regulator
VPKHSGREAFARPRWRLAAGERCLPEGHALPGPDTGGAAAEAVARLAQTRQARILELLCQGRLNKQIA